MSKRIRVLIVDDSAFARKVIREVLTRDPDIEVVGIARDGLEALEKIADLNPDVITLDLLMPDLDGLGVLRALPKNNSPRVIIVSASNSDSDLAIEALQIGAIDLVTKPTPLPTDRLYDLSSELVIKVKAAASATPGLPSSAAKDESSANDTDLPKTFSLRSNIDATTTLVVIGTSTGGPQALTSLFKALPKDLPVPMAIALHIPPGYTATLAARLTQVSSVPVDEATDGMELVAGRAVIAPGGKHLRIFRIEKKFFVTISREPFDSIYHPSVNILFSTAAEAAGSGTLALVMTGMGDDGAEGAKLIREAGGRVLAESASSCVVYGMPRCVIENKSANFEAPLPMLPKLLVEQIYS